MTDVSVLGAGLVARWSALSMARLGLRVALSPSAWQAAGTADIRTYAITEANAAWLRVLGVWPEAAACRVDAMQVHSTALGVRGPAAASGNAALSVPNAQAWIVPADALADAACAALRASTVQAVADPPAAIEVQRLIVIAEGSARRVLVRELGVPVESTPYEASAVAAVVATELPHAHVARQWMHEPHEVLALLPLVANAEHINRVGVVWSMPHEAAQAHARLDDEAWCAALEARSEAALGRVLASTARSIWPLKLSRATALSGPGWVALGDAAHTVHPLAGLGLNLGVGDVRCLERVLAEHRGAESWRRLGDARRLRAYARERALPVAGLSRVTDALFGALDARWAPLDPARQAAAQIWSLAPRGVQDWLGASLVRATQRL